MKMRELEKRTGVNRETIRVYLRHGLMPEPHRPKPNVADYGEEHVSSVLAIRKLQKDKRVPLHLIKRAMEGDTSVMPADATAFPHLDSLIAARVGVDDALVPLSVTLTRNPHAQKDARLLEDVGAITLVRRRGKPHLSRMDAELVSLWGDMRAAGFTEELGFSADVCRLHVEAAQRLAHMELRLFLARVTGLRNEGPTADMAQAALTHLLSFFGLIRVKTVLADLRQHSAETSAPAPATSAKRSRRPRRPSAAPARGKR
ncbi:MAG: MerR family transcriptional regulator [Nevskiales bacterium]|nr:MerR family transcriptional regulator [Nevskiales bacterium]